MRRFTYSSQNPVPPGPGILQCPWLPGSSQHRWPLQQELPPSLNSFLDNLHSLLGSIGCSRTSMGLGTQSKVGAEATASAVLALRSYLHRSRRCRRPGAGWWHRRCSGSTRGGRSGPRHSAAPSRTHASCRSSRCRCHPGSVGTPSVRIPGAGERSSV